MTAFVQQYAVLRWSAAFAFAVAAVIVATRLALPLRVEALAHSGFRAEVTSGDSTAAGDSAAAGASAVVDNPAVVGDSATAREVSTSAHRESDAAHLLMCLVMLTMLVFPATADPHALRGVLTAMAVVFVLLPLIGLAQHFGVEQRSGVDQHPDGTRHAAITPHGTAITPHRNGFDAVIHRAGALGYHAVAAAAMLYAMSGHNGAGHSGPAVAPALALATLFCLDAAVMLVLPATHRPHLLAHPSAGASAVIPHLVMDLGTAYMLIAAVHG